MRFVSRDMDYAMQALIFMAGHAGQNNKEVFTVDEIAMQNDLPERFLRRILQRLAKGNILFSYKGKNGGFSFAKSPGDVCFTDVIRIFQGDVDLTNCMLKGISCPNQRRCSLRKRLKKINSLVNRELDSITISSLL